MKKITVIIFVASIILFGLNVECRAQETANSDPNLKTLEQKSADSLAAVNVKNNESTIQNSKECCDTKQTTQVIMEMDENGNWIKTTKDENAPVFKKGTIYDDGKTFRIRSSDLRTGKFDPKVKWALEHGRKVQTVKQ